MLATNQALKAKHVQLHEANEHLLEAKKAKATLEEVASEEQMQEEAEAARGCAFAKCSQLEDAMTACLTELHAAVDEKKLCEQAVMQREYEIEAAELDAKLERAMLLKIQAEELRVRQQRASVLIQAMTRGLLARNGLIRHKQMCDARKEQQIVGGMLVKVSAKEKLVEEQVAERVAAISKVRELNAKIHEEQRGWLGIRRIRPVNVDEREGYKSRIAKLESDERQYRRELGVVKQVLTGLCIVSNHLRV